MTPALPIVLGVLLLPGLQDVTSGRAAGREESVTITSDRSDFDREAHVALFDSKVRVDYSGAYQLYADRVFAFMDAQNRLSRIVALGNVAITNEARSGACASATFRRAVGEIEMFGKAGEPARLEDGGTNKIFGRRIKFWVDTEQVEVVGSEITVDKGKEDLKRL